MGSDPAANTAPRNAVERFGWQVIRFRWLVVALCVLAVMGLGKGGERLEFTADYRVFFSKENPQLEAFENLQDTYTKNDNVLFMLLPDSGDVFSRESLSAVEYLTARAWETPYSIRVDSLSNFQHTYAEGDDLIVADLVEDAASLEPSALDDIRRIALAEPMLVNNTVSPDGQATGVNITIELPGINPITEGPEVARFAREVRSEFEERFPDIPVYLTGVAEMNNAFTTHSQGDMMKLVPIAFVVIILGIFLFIRSVSGTVATVFIVIFSVMAAMGTAGWMGFKLTGPSVSAPTMILTLAVADSIHILVSMLLSMRRGMEKRAAIVESLRINFMPVLLTTVTTMIGFMSLNFSDSPPFRDLGNITAMGVGYAFVFSILFLPAIMAILPVRVRPIESERPRYIDHIADFSIRHQARLFYVIGALSVVLVGMVFKNELNDIYVEYFDETVPFRYETDIVTEKLAGVYLVEYSLDSGESGGISNPEFLGQVERFGDWMGEQPEVTHVSIITDVFKRLNRNLHEDDDSWYRLPGERELAAQYLLLYEMSLPYGLDLNNQINVDKSATRVTVRLETLSTKQVLAFEDRVNDWFDANAPELKSLGASPTVIFSHIGIRNIKSMLIGTTIALFMISFLLIFALRSLKIGLLSMIPNLLPVGAAFGIWGLFVGEIGLALSVVAGVTLGIVVDDTVHFLSKYLRARRERQLDPENAIRFAFSTVGVALVVNTAVLVAGFLVLSTSSFKINSEMGLVTAMTITIALLVDFLFLPAILMKAEKNSS